MSVKNLFNKRLNNKVVTKAQADNLTNDIESSELTSDVVKSENILIPHVDFSNPKNFSRYGSAEKYYEDSFARVYKTFPYDGSTSEIQKWQNESSYLDRWIFDNVYPKSTGHIKLGTNQSITAKGGPNNQPGITEGDSEELSKQFPVKSGNSNIWDTSIYRNSNLYVDGALGNTVEFWAKLESTFSGSFVAFNVGNEAQSAIMSVRFQTTDGLLTLVYKDDTASGLTATTNIADLVTTTWNHLAFSFVNEGGQVRVEVYKNGTRIHTQTTGTAIGSVTQVDSKLNINGASTGTLSADGFYVDEFRFWKQRRTEEQIGRHWFTQITGGTNTDNNKYSEENNSVDLGIYYKFNEGITTDDSIDTTVLDYSGRISNGTIANYSSTVRNTGSAINESGLVDADDYELPDPIIYSTHPSYVSVLEEYKLLGRTHDYTNNASIYHTMPAWILEEDDVNGQNIKELTQVISSHFDDTHLRISELANLKNNEYYSLEEESDKPFFFVNRALESTGLIVPDLFVEATAFEEILSRGEQELFDEKIQDIKNVIYQNIYNNVSYIYKSKGAEKAFRNLIRCFGVDDELIKINLYSDNSDYTLEDTRRTTAIKKNVVDFNDPDRNDALVYSNEVAARAETSSFIPGVPSAKSNLISLTFEAEAIFPKRLSVDHPSHVSPTGLEKQIAMLGEADSTASGDAIYQASTNPIFSIYAKKDTALSENIKFALSSTLLGADIETDATYKETYDNSKWNFAVRLSPIKEIGDTVLGGATSDYNLEFYGVKMLADEVEEEFTKTTVITSSNARAVMELAKFVSVGALKTDADPTNATTVRDTDIKVSSVRFWYDYLSDAEVKGHASDASNFGRLNPNADAYAFVTSLSSGLTTDIRVPRKDTLALFWDFSNVTVADSSGEFIVEDLSDRITDGRYGWFTDLLDKQITGRGRRFLADDTQVVNKEFLYSAKHRTPEVLNSEDLIEIRTQDDDKFTRESRPITHFFAAEKSMYQVIDDDIINLFASIVEFNDLIGQPVNRYRMNYKALEKFRQLYFQKVQNVPSLEKYVHFYKWLDSSIGMMIEQLIPISSNFSSTLRTMVENHTLERNKYWTKFPTLEMKQDIPEGQVKGIREMLYDWESGSAPVPSDDACLWNEERVERTDSSVTSGVSTVDDDREAIRNVAVRDIKGQTKVVKVGSAFIEEASPILYDHTTTTSYEGSTYAVRRLSKPYKFGVDKALTIRGGANYAEITKDPNEFIRASTTITTGTSGVQLNGVEPNPETCYDKGDKEKFRRAHKITLTNSVTSTQESLKGSQGMFPRYGETPTDATAELTNIHNDSYGDDAEVPIQGPFTNQWVGGNQHRHVYLATPAADRPELYLNVANTLRHPHEVDPDNPSARYTRDELAKRPLNIENIKFEEGEPGPLGNYSRVYQVVQTSGRTQNNRFLVRNPDYSITKQASSVVTDAFDFTLPDRTKNADGTVFGRTEHVFVERFSAPGDPLTSARGQLDVEAEEFAAYNSLNFRNLTVRSHLNFWQTQHSAVQSGSQGYRLMEGFNTGLDGVAAYQKNNRNPSARMSLKIQDDPSNHSGSYGCVINYDNFFIGHQIPRSDFQYAWVTSSALPDSSVIDCNNLATIYPRLGGYVSGYSNASIDVTFVSQSYNPSVTKTLSIESGLVEPSGSVMPLSGSGDYTPNDLFLDRNGPYQGASWKLFRGQDRPLVIEQRRQNTISVISRSDENTFENYVEPVVTWNLPMGRALVQDYGLSTERNISLIESYSNNLEFFANPNLRARVSVVKNPVQFYDQVMTELRDVESSLVYKRFTYGEVIYPKHRNVGLTKIRERASLDNYNVFWKDKFLDRIRKDSEPNKLGWTTRSEVRNFLKQKNSDFSMDNFYYSQTIGAVETVYNVVGALSYVGEQRYLAWIRNKKFSTLPGSALTPEASGVEGLRADLPSPEIEVKYVLDSIKDVEFPPTPSPQLYYNPVNGHSPESGWISRTSELSDNSPAYNDYDSYNLELRSIGQNYGILSEFRISQHMEQYVKEQGGDFRAKNYNFLSLDGASYDANRHQGKTHTQFSGKTVTTKNETVYSLSGFDERRDTDHRYIFANVRITSYPKSFTDQTTKVINNADKPYEKFNPIKASETFTLENSILTGRKIEPTYADGRLYNITPYMSGYNAAAKFNLSSTSDDFLAVKLNKVSQVSDASLLRLDEKAFTFSVWAQPDSSLQSSRDNSAIATLGSATEIAGNYESIILMSRFKHPNGVHPTKVHSSNQLGLTVVFSNSKDVVNGEFNKISNLSSVYCFFNSDGTPAFMKPGEFNHVAFQFVPFLATTRPMMIKMWLNGEEVYGVHAKAIDATQTENIYGYSPCPVGAFPTSDYPWGQNLDAGLKLHARVINNYALGCGSFSHSLGNKLEANERMSFSGLLDEHSLWTGILSGASIERLYNNGIPGNILEDKYNSDITGGYTTLPAPPTPTEWDINYSTNGITIDDSGSSITNPSLGFEYLPAQTQANFDLPVWHRIGVPYVEDIKTCDGWDDEFFNSYVHTDNVKFLEKVVDDHEALGAKPRERVRLKVSAIKKLLPYEGFYPQDRTVQIAKLFSDKVRNIPKKPEGAFFKEQRVQAALQHFFAPGILYNSIKAGLSVDWAAFTDKTGLEQDFAFDGRTIIGDEDSTSFATYAPNWYATRTDRNSIDEALGEKPINFRDSNLYISQPSFKEGLQNNGFVILQEPDTRLPFEALLNPRDYLSRHLRTPSPEGLVFHHSDLEIFDWNAEGNFLIINHVEEDSSENPEVKTTRISIGDPNVPVNEGIDWDVKIDFRRTPEGLSIARRNSTTGEVERTSANQFSTSQSEITSARLNEEIAVKLCRAINENQELSVIAIPGFTPSYTLVPGRPRANQTSDRIAQKFEEIYEQELPELFEGANLGIQTNGSWKIRLFYVGPVASNKTKEEAMDAQSFTGGSEMFKDSGKTYGELTTVQSTRIMGVLNSANSFDGNTMIGWANYSIESELGLKILNSNGNINFSSISSSNAGSGFLDATIFGMTTELRQGEQGQVVQSDRATTQGPISFYNPVESEAALIEKSPSKFYLMTPEYYRLNAKTPSEDLKQFSYPSYEWSDASNDDIRYELAINNFLAEVPRFFLKNEGLTSIASKPEKEFKSMSVGKTYYMDVSVEKTDGFEIALSPNRRSGRFTEGRYFGPSFRWKKAANYHKPQDFLAGPAQAPYVPPYLHGKSTTRISFVPRESRVHTLEEILSGLSMEDVTEEQYNYFKSQASGSYFEDAPAWKSRMTVRSSFNLTGKTSLKKKTFDTSVSVENPLSEAQSQAVVTSVIESEGTAYDTWVISPKFECPVLNFNNSENDVMVKNREAAGVYEIKEERSLKYEMPSYPVPTTIDYKASNDESAVSTTVPQDYLRASGTGIWAGYGSVPSQSEGIFVSIEESFTKTTSKTGSLIDVCGFTATQEKIGDIAESREISEAIVMIPFLDERETSLSQYVRENPSFNSDADFTTENNSPNGERTIARQRTSPTAPITETEGQQVRTTRVDGRNFISITKENFLAQKNNIENGLPAVTLADRADLSEPKQKTQISRMINMMKKYNLPPRYDFITYPMSAGENPFVMYFFEFTQTLGKQDLADIWQGVKPEIARKSVTATEEIVHDLGPSEFFEGNEIPPDIRWMVFKVKRKASADYFEMAEDSSSDSRFKFDFKVGKKKPEYSYNYPYDFFSLIEMAKIETGIDIETEPEDLTKIRNRNQE